MDTFASTLRRATEQRSAELTSRISELQGRVGGDSAAVSELLDVFAFFPKALRAVVDKEWDRNLSETSRVQILRPLLRYVTDVANFVENWLSHTGTSAVPLYLLDAVERTSRSLGLRDRKAVVATGPADNFTTIPARIGEVLLSRLGPLCPELPNSLASDFALMQAPRFEGRVARWHPILLGHEIAHIAVREKETVRALDLESVIDRRAAAELEVPGSGAKGPAGSLRLLEIAENWATELLCDAFAVHQFGAGAVVALSEFLEVIGATNLLSDTHPPGRLRIALLTRWLPTLDDSRAEALIGPWRSLAREPIKYDAEWAQFLVDIMLSQEGRIRALVNTWSPAYDTSARIDVIHASARLLKSGIPPESKVSIGGLLHDVTEPDVIIASWLGSQERYETPVDRLAEKALADFALLERWREAEAANDDAEPVANNEQAEPVANNEQVEPVANNDGEAPTLSSLELVRRMERSDESRLVVTPLLAQQVSGASIDLRLGNTFIVFVRSTTAFLDPLDEDGDPRRVQRRLQLAWGENFVLHPGELVLAATLEYIVLPSDLCGQVLSRSSYGRLGLLSATAVQVHPHFHGCLTLELVNLGTVPLKLTPGERVAQLVVARTGNLPAPLPSKYHCAIGPEFSKVRTDAEATVLRTLIGSSQPGARRHGA